MLHFVLLVASLILPTQSKKDCVAGDWEQWSLCSETCGSGGTRERSRSIAQLPTADGRQCSELEFHQVEACNRYCFNNGVLTDTRCDCTSGYTGTCCELDIDECALNNGGCQQLCVNSKGSFTCQCFQGFETNNNGYCVDIDECQTTAKGVCDGICGNFPGSYKCACLPGNTVLFTDGRSCVAPTYCTADADGEMPVGCSCGESGSLVVYNNEMVCACPAGFTIDSNGECQAQDPCAVPSFCVGGTCHKSPLTGEALCDCGIGRGLDVKGERCMDVDQCQAGLSQCSHTCETVNAGHVCLCPAGMILGTDHKTCKDENECLRDPGPCSHSCTNLHLSFYCSCPSGMELEADNRTCCEVGKCINPISGKGSDKTTSIAVGVSVTTLIVVGVLVFIIYRMVKRSLSTNEKVMREIRHGSDVYYNRSNAMELEQRAMGGESSKGPIAATRADHYSTFQKRRPFSIEEDEYEGIKSTKDL